MHDAHHKADDPRTSISPFAVWPSLTCALGPRMQSLMKHPFPTCAPSIRTDLSTVEPSMIDDPLMAQTCGPTRQWERIDRPSKSANGTRLLETMLPGQEGPCAGLRKGLQWMQELFGANV